MAAVPLVAMACAGITEVPTFGEWFGERAFPNLGSELAVSELAATQNAIGRSDRDRSPVPCSS